MPSAPVSRVRPTAYSPPSVVRAWQAHRQCVHRSLQTVASGPNASTPIGSCPLRTPPGKSGELAGADTTMKNGPTGRSAIDRRFCCKPRRRHPARQRDPSRKTLTPGGPVFSLATRALGATTKSGRSRASLQCSQVGSSTCSLSDSAASKAAVAWTAVPAKYGLETMVDAQVARYQCLTRHLSQLEALPSNPPSSNRAKSTRCRPL
jgi:hypothetical protein